jgi:hypothetical protein
MSETGNSHYMITRIRYSYNVETGILETFGWSPECSKLGVGVVHGKDHAKHNF